MIIMSGPLYVSGSYPHDVNPNLSMLSGLTEQYMSAAAAHTAASVAGHSMFANPTQNSYAMWNFAPSNPSSCAMSQYMRSPGAYALPPTPETPNLAVATTSPCDGMTSSAYDQHTSSLAAIAAAVSVSQSHTDSTASVFSATSSSREAKSSWSPLTPPS